MAGPALGWGFCSQREQRGGGWRELEVERNAPRDVRQKWKGRDGPIRRPLAVASAVDRRGPEWASVEEGRQDMTAPPLLCSVSVTKAFSGCSVVSDTTGPPMPWFDTPFVSFQNGYRN